MPHRVLLYTITDREDIACAWLEAHGLTSEFELVTVTHAPLVPPRRDQLEGFEAVLGEFMPIPLETVPDMAATGVRLVASMSIGINHMQVNALREAGVLVANCPGYCADEVAEHAVALMLDLARQVTMANRDVMAGNWNPDFGFEMRRVSGSTCGLVFFGNIGRRVAQIARGLGMRVVVWAPTKTAEELSAAGCEKANDLDTLLRESDFVSLHCPLIPMTEGLIGARELGLMKPTAILVNTSRGAVVQEDALADALERGVIRGAGLDVLSDEAHINERLVRCPNCIVTPHSAYLSREASEALVTMSMESVAQLLVEGRTPEHLV